MNMNKFKQCDCKYKEAFNNNHTPMLIIETETLKIDDANTAACDYYGYSREEILNMKITHINILSREEILKEMDKAREEGRKYFRFKHRLSNGEIRDVEVYSGPIKVEGKIFLFSVIHDTVEKIRLERDFIINKAYFDSLFNNSPEAIAIVDKDFRVLNINKTFQEVFQYDLREIKGKDMTQVLCVEELYDDSFNFRRSISAGKFVKEEVRRKKKDGQLIDVLLLGFPLVIEGKTIGAYLIYSDISEVKAKEEQIEILTRTDVLTGLLNRDCFLNVLDYEILQNKANEGSGKIGLLVLNVNELKEINEALGHLAGDHILKEYALRLKASVREQDVVARFSEDEFGVLIPQVQSLKELKDISDKIFTSLSGPFSIGKDDFQITTSMGIAIYPDDGVDSTSLIRKAEVAMNKAKESSANRPIIFNNALDTEVQEYFWMKNDLARALSNDELFLNYQPIYDTSIDKLIGVEALIRWRHKEKGIILPTEFIPLAERSGMIHPIGDWVLFNACKQNKKWQDRGYEPVYISVNVSVLQLEQPGFCRVVEEMLKETGLEPEYLQLEITETYFIQKYDSIKDTINELSQLGVRLAIDDFGTGYSSLSQLCTFDVNNIKIDKTFIDGIERDLNKSKIVKALISLAESLNISLTAEGVETQEQLIFLKKNKCTVAQGFLFSEPVDPDGIERMLAKYKGI